MSALENPPAFPVSSIDGFTQHGMDLRDWFAGQALNGVILATSSGEHVPSLLTEWKLSVGQKPSIEQAMAADAYRIADAILAERTKACQP